MILISSTHYAKSTKEKTPKPTMIVDFIYIFDLAGVNPFVVTKVVRLLNNKNNCG